MKERPCHRLFDDAGEGAVPGGQGFVGDGHESYVVI